MWHFQPSAVGRNFNLSFNQYFVKWLKRQTRGQTHQEKPPTQVYPLHTHTHTPSTYVGSDALEQVLRLSVSHSFLQWTSLAQSSPEDSQLVTHLHASLTGLETPFLLHVQRLKTQRDSTLRTTNWLHITERLTKWEVLLSYSYTRTYNEDIKLNWQMWTISQH